MVGVFWFVFKETNYSYEQLLSKRKSPQESTEAVIASTARNM